MYTPAAVLEARFLRHYGVAAWHDEGARTRDGVTPFGLFWFRYRAIAANMAFERLSAARALGHTMSQAFSKKADGLPTSLRNDLTAAFMPVEE